MEKLVNNIVSVWVLEDRRQNLEQLRAVKWIIRQLFPKLAYLLDELCLLTQRAVDLPTESRKFERCPQCGTPLEVLFEETASR